MKALDSLAVGLKAFSLSPMEVSFDAPVQMRRYAEKLVDTFGAPSDRPSTEKMTPALRRLLESGDIRNSGDLKYICYGLPYPVGPAKKRVIATPGACAVVFERLAGLSSKKRSLRGCYQGLLATYFSLDGRSAPEPVRTQWLAIRTYLRENLATIASLQPTPRWATLLLEHQNLFGDTPCNRYASQILAGDKAEFEALTKELRLLDQSWLFLEAAYSAVRMACELSNADFQAKIPLLLQLISDHQLVQSQGLTLLLKRYVDVPGQPKHEELLKLSVSLWHNPLNSRNNRNWDLAGDAATSMVKQWLKDMLIEDFFEHLSADGATDKRRVKFWKRYIDSIENMYFALGSGARYSRDPDVMRLRTMMGDNLINLEGGTASDNGFFMIMKDRVIAEFGETGYAVYIFHQDHLPFKLAGDISVNGRSEWRRLPQAHHLSHKDNVNGYWTWEERFKAVLTAELRVFPDDDYRAAKVKISPVPAQRAGRPGTPAAAPIVSDVPAIPYTSTAKTPDLNTVRALCAKFGVAVVVDKTANRWIVRASATNSALSKALTELQFSYDHDQVCWERKI